MIGLVVLEVLLLCVCAQTSAACQRRCRGSSTGQLISSSSSAGAARGQLSGISSSRGGSAAALRGQVGGAALQLQLGGRSAGQLRSSSVVYARLLEKKIPWLRPTIVTLVDWVNTQGPGVWGVSLLQLQAGVLGGRAACVVGCGGV